MIFEYLTEKFEKMISRKDDYTRGINQGLSLFLTPSPYVFNSQYNTYLNVDNQ